MFKIHTFQSLNYIYKIVGKGLVKFEKIANFYAFASC